MLFEITYADRGREVATYWTAPSADEARAQFDAESDYALCDVLLVERVRATWEKE